METRSYFIYRPWYAIIWDEYPIDNLTWTGRMQYKTVDGYQKIYVERQVTLLGIPLWTEWVNENRFKFYEVEVNIVECDMI